MKHFVALALAGVVSLAPAAAPGANDPNETLLRTTLEGQGLPAAEIERLMAAREAADGTLGDAAGANEIPDPARALIPPPIDPGAADSVDVVPVAPDSTLLAPPPPVGADLAKAPPRFGADLFTLPTRAFEPPAYGPIDPGYRLGPGDEIVLDVWGDVVLRTATTIDRQGNVMLKDVGQVNLAGSTVTEAARRLRGRLGAAYSGLASDPPTTFLELSLGRLRPVKVFVVGEVARPGGYDLSAASTVFHALYLAGGPGPLGTFRDVRVVRGNRVVATLDVYDYLLRGVRAGDVRLENDDTIFVPVRGKTVIARGEITRPGVYELTEGETFADLVRMAGGPTGRTHLVRARVDRVLPPSRRAPGEPPAVTLDVPLADVLAGRATFELDDLDDVVFAPVPADRGEFVVVRGNVWYPSTYEFRPGMRVADALAAAGGVRPDTFDGRAYLVRTRPDLTRETLTFDVGRVRAGDLDANVPLAARDEISIRSRWELFDRPTVSIAGAVRNPGEYELTDGLTVGELLVQAGGFLEYAWTDSVEVSRVYPEDGDARRIAETFRVPVGDDFLARAELPAFALQNHDRVFVRRQPFWELQRDVRVAGAVMYPGTYSLESQTERLATVIDRAGGLLENAYPEGFQLFRRQDDIGRVSADLARALEDRGSDANLVLVSGDSLYVPERPMTVRVSGAVNFPTSHVYRPGKGIGWYVENSGGYRDEAKKSGTTLVYSTGRAAKVRRWRPDPEVRPGSEIVVPAKIPGEGTDWGRVVVDIASVAASLATTWLVVDTIVGR